MVLRRVILLGAIALAACSSGGGGGGAARMGGGSANSSATARRGPSNRILNEEIVALGAQADNAYDIVERLRPTMFRTRGATSFGNAAGPATPGIVIFLDDARLGSDVSALRNVAANQVREIRYHTATEATQLWGTGFGGGAIQVLSKK